MASSELYRKAAAEIERRRMAVNRETEEREREIFAKFPEIAEIRSVMAQTAAQLSACIIKRDKNYKDAFDRIRKNNQDAARMISEILTANGYPEDYLSPHYRCEFCLDRGYVDGKPCGCLTRLIGKLAAEELNKSANMPGANFDNFSTDYYKNVIVNNMDCYKVMQQNFEYCKKYAAEFSCKSESILMYGRTGLGKTHLSMAIARELAEKGFTVIYGSVINLLKKVEDENFGRSEQNGTLESLFNCDLLILDDLGAENVNSFNGATLYNIINTRINKGVPFIISTNFTLEEIQNFYGERIASRITFCGKRMQFTGRDIRQLRSGAG